LITVADQSGLDSLGLLNTGIPGSSLTHDMDMLFSAMILCAVVLNIKFIQRWVKLKSYKCHKIEILL